MDNEEIKKEILTNISPFADNDLSKEGKHEILSDDSGHYKSKQGDKRRLNGAKKGENRGQGRKRKNFYEPAKKLDKSGKATDYALKALTSVFGSELKAWMFLADKAKKGDKQCLNLLWQYRYGKPTEKIEAEVNTKVHIPLVTFAEPEKTIDIEAKELVDKAIESTEDEQ